MFTLICNQRLGTNQGGISANQSEALPTMIEVELSVPICIIIG